MPKREDVPTLPFNMAQPRWVLLTLLAIAAPSVWGLGSRHHRPRQFNAGHDAYFSAAGQGLSAASSHAVECDKVYGNAVDNGRVQCSFSGCRVKCTRGHAMGNRRTLFINCDSATGELTYLGKPWRTSLPACLPTCGRNGCPAGSKCIAPNKCKVQAAEVSQCPPGFTGAGCKDFLCDPPCQNGGSCIFVGVCECPGGYWGLQCQNHRCAIPESPIEHATYGGDNDLTRLEVKCEFGYKMKSQSPSMKFICQHGKWMNDLGTIDDVNVNCYT